jgi:hypothetical protein
MGRANRPIYETDQSPTNNQEMTVAGRGRQPGFVMSDTHRVKIRNSNILNALIEHVEGKREMSATQVTAGLGLLRKIMPDLAACAETDNDGALRSIKSMTDAELEAIAAGSSLGTTETPESSKLLN